MTIPKQQYAALPFIVSANGTEVCLITSRETGRWIIPKGWPKKGMAPHDLAALEAFEEAGLRGRVDPGPIGRFHYVKRLDNGSEVNCEVSVYPLLVESQAVTWPEQGQRNSTWVQLEDAAKLVDDEELSSLLRRFDPKDSLSEEST